MPYLGLCVIAAPAFAPEPLLRQAVDWYTMLGIVWQVLIKVGQTVGIFGQAVIDHSILITSSHLPVAGAKDDKKIGK